ncbi:MAG: hypothetical protein IAE84_03505 [Saprospiraceae bacterium]|jgi:uncharacterized membrane protein|nr:hypothetical protein [Saprospiraceae bacterium]HRD80189.1 hypothetical protein [Saprospiraceae bacterium]HRF39347.1 hypothetical protein [Saprospiraceae bacterium]HRJ15742.1 hypothetical protein [Saprospiraceae bacterium]HRK82753.1 hypothetical protein [Saprospiraceae bacterium]
MKYLLFSGTVFVVLLAACGTPKQGSQSNVVAEKSYNCVGTEPFWNVKVEASGITFLLMGEEAVVYPYKAARKEGAAQVYETAVQGSRLKLSISEEGCSDGMSDTNYPYKVTVEKDGTTYQGCAFLLGKNPMRGEER